MASSSAGRDKGPTGMRPIILPFPCGEQTRKSGSHSTMQAIGPRFFEDFLKSSTLGGLQTQVGLGWTCRCSMHCKAARCDTEARGGGTVATCLREEDFPGFGVASSANDME